MTTWPLRSTRRPWSSPAGPPTTSPAAIRASLASWPAASGRRPRRCTSNRASPTRAAAVCRSTISSSSYYRQVEALVAAGADLLMVETGNDILVLKACLFAIDKFNAERKQQVPTIVSGTIYRHGRTLFCADTGSVLRFRGPFRCPGRGLQLRRRHRSASPRRRKPGPDFTQADRVLSQRRPARRHGRVRRHRPGSAPPRSSASSPATAGSTSSAAAAARRRTGLPRIDRRSRVLPPRRIPDLPGWSYFSGDGDRSSFAPRPTSSWSANAATSPVR